MQKQKKKKFHGMQNNYPSMAILNSDLFHGIKNHHNDSWNP